jgi:hypothetical protein
MNKPFAIPAMLAAIACAALSIAASASAAELPEMQVGTMIVSSGTAAPSADAVDSSASEPDDADTEETAS